MFVNNFSLVVYDLPVVNRFFRSVALAVSLQQHTRAQWVPYRDSALFNAFYAFDDFLSIPQGNAFSKQAIGFAEIIRRRSKSSIKPPINCMASTC